MNKGFVPLFFLVMILYDIHAYNKIVFALNLNILKKNERVSGITPLERSFYCNEFVTIKLI